MKEKKQKRSFGRQMDIKENPNCPASVLKLWSNQAMVHTHSNEMTQCTATIHSMDKSNAHNI